MKKEIKVPSVGESVSQAEIESWEKKDGEIVQKGEVLVILETDKASLEIPAESRGKLSIIKQKGDTVKVGEAIAYLEELEEEVSVSTPSPVNKSPSVSLPPSASPPSLSSTKVPAGESLSPAVKRLVEQNQMNIQNLKGTGRGDRLTKEDILRALKESPQEDRLPFSFKEGQKREPMTSLRKRTAERLIFSQQSTATLSTFNEVDMSRIMHIRKKYKNIFLEKQGVKLGLMGFFVKAVVVALKEYPRINAFISGTDIVYNESCHIGIAVSTDKGLVVPVIRFADQLSLSEIEKQILNYSEKAKTRKLTPDDLLGGTFTISNGGVFGSLLSTPILNPPQSGILGMHKIEQRPVVIDNEIDIRPMMYLTLSYDHRMVDGRESVGFLVKVKEGIEDPTRLLMEI